MDTANLVWRSGLLSHSSDHLAVAAFQGRRLELADHRSDGGASADLIHILIHLYRSCAGHAAVLSDAGMEHHIGSPDSW